MSLSLIEEHASVIKDLSIMIRDFCLATETATPAEINDHPGDPLSRLLERSETTNCPDQQFIPIPKHAAWGKS